jgi:hypothetical protein
MKKIATAILLSFAGIAVGAESITVYGYGADRESAKKDAFRTAIENICGTAVLSDREHFNGKTVHDQVISYSSCRVEKYEILEDIGTQIKINVTVTNNKTSERLFSKSNSKNQFDSNIVNAQVHTIRHEQQKGDRLIDEVFRDYPYRAYNLQQTKNPYFTTDSYRNFYLMVPYDIRWNYNFVTSMNEIFSEIETPIGRGVINVSAKNPNDLLLGKHNKYFIDDLHRLDYLKSKFVNQNELRLKVKARDDRGRQVLNICYNPEYRAGGIFYSIGVNNRLTVFGNDRNAGTMRIKLTVPADVIYDIYVDVVAARDCKL